MHERLSTGNAPSATPMINTHRLFSLPYILVTLMFAACGLALIAFAGMQLWSGIDPMASTPVTARLSAILESIGLLTIAVAALELSQTVLEEEVVRTSQMSAPTRVRRFLSRFLIVVVVSLSVESLVAVFKMVQEAPEMLPRAATIALAAAALLTAWGAFIRLNRSAEELEPEAMEQAKREDEKVEP